MNLRDYKVLLRKRDLTAYRRYNPATCEFTVTIHDCVSRDEALRVAAKYGIALTAEPTRSAS